MQLKSRSPLKAKVDNTVELGPFEGMLQAGRARQVRPNVLAEELLQRGCTFCQSQVWDEAEREFQKALKMAPDYAEASNNAGLCRLMQGDAEGALQLFQKALASFPDWTIASSNLALAHQRLEQYAEAEAGYRAALAKTKSQPSLWYSLGDVLTALNRPADALEAFRSAVSMAPKFGLAHYRIGMHQIRAKEFDAAEASFNEALKSGANADAAAMLGALLARKGDLGKARTLYQQAKQAEPVPLQATRGLERIELLDRSVVSALEEAKLFETRSAAEIYFELGLVELKSGNETAAEKAFEQALHTAPDWSAPRQYLGLFAAKRGDARGARANWEAAAQGEPENGRLPEQIGYLSLAMGLQKDAEAQFKRAAALGREVPIELNQGQ